MTETHPTEIDIIVGRNLGKLRSAKGLTQKELGDACADRLSSQQISKYELGDNQISANRLAEFAVVLGCSVTDLFEGVKEILPQLEVRRSARSAMDDYQSLPKPIQDSLRVLMRAMAKELGAKMDMGAA